MYFCKKYTCDTCQPRDSDTEDSDEEDKIVRNRIKEHERRKDHLIKEKERLLKIIQEENKRLIKCKKEEDRKIQEIKSILSDSEPGSSNQPNNSCLIGKQKHKLTPPPVFILSNSSSNQDRYAINMPRRSNSDVPDNACDNDVYNIEDSDEEEDVESNKLLKIENVCGGSEARKLNAKSGISETSIELSDDSDNEDLFIFEPDSGMIKTKSLQ